MRAGIAQRVVSMDDSPQVLRLLAQRTLRAQSLACAGTLQNGARMRPAFNAEMTSNLHGGP